jgi:hypothetical protein
VHVTVSPLTEHVTSGLLAQSFDAHEHDSA